MKIGTFVASLVFLSCFGCQRRLNTTPSYRYEWKVQLRTRGDKDEAISAATVDRYSGDQMACSVRHMHMAYVLL
jgi:hypothetical protein